MQNPVSLVHTRCCICGGGPAGIMLGFLLARAGVEVVVLEKHKDFFRDFRGDTIHPSTIELLYELGLLEEFLKVPHQEIEHLEASYNDQEFTIADFTHLPVHKKVLILMPQWDFLNFIEKHASQYKTFKIYKEANVTELVKVNNRVAGIRAETPAGMLEVRSALTVGCNGRRSTVRTLADLTVIDTGVPIDVLWFRLSKRSGDKEQTFGRISNGKFMVLLNRGDYWQCAYVISKGQFESKQSAGMEAFRNELASVTPFLSNRLDELKDWEDIKLLSVSIDHLEKWYSEGLLCIGDAAHAMSPIGGVGINLAIQDAVAAANILYRPLLNGEVITPSLLNRVQERRNFPRKVIQGIQIFIHKNVLGNISATAGSTTPPFIFRMMRKFPYLRRFPARLIGIGPRPEHVRTPGNS